jgi:glycosyltransferase involved in cell wall biosynthesis
MPPGGSETTNLASNPPTLRIAVITQGYYPPLVGGQEIHARCLAVHLAREGHSVVVITRGEKDDGVAQEDGVTVDRVPTWPLFGSQRLSVARFALGLLIRFHARRRSIDVIHALPIASAGFFVVLLGKLYGKPTVVRDGTCKEALEDYVRNPVRRFMVRQVLTHASKVYCDHPSIRGTFDRIVPGSPVAVIANPVDAEEFAPGEERSPEAFVVLHVSRLEGFKGLRHVIEALPVVRERVPGIVLRIVGDGPEEESLRALAATLGVSENVDFVGARPFAEMPEWFRQADVFVQPSLTEELPNTVLQALSTGLPVLASTLVATEDMLVDGETALLVEPGDVKGITEALLRIHDDRGLRERLGSAARALALGELSWHAHGDRVVGLYESGLAAVSPARR